MFGAQVVTAGEDGHLPRRPRGRPELEATGQTIDSSVCSCGQQSTSEEAAASS